MNRLYNTEIKEKYLETLAENSVAPIKNALYKANDIEETIEKDLFDFTPEEIKQVLIHANSKSIAGVRNILSYLNGYVNWAIGKGYRNNALNPIINIDTSNESLMEYIDKSRKIYYTNEEIDQIIETLLNSQDKVMLHLAFYEGITMEELMDLKISDVDTVNGILKCEKRQIKLTNEFSLGLIERAYNENEYIAINTEARRDLADSEFIIRNTVSARTKNVTQISKSVLFSRISNIRERFGYEDFTFKAISKSGMIYDAYKIGKINSEILGEIADKFGVNKINVRGYEYHNVSILKKFINKENIVELYGAEITEE